MPTASPWVSQEVPSEQSVLTLLLLWWSPRSGRGSEKANCLVSVGGEIPSGAELESHCVLF